MSIRAYLVLRRSGFQNLYRYAEGLKGWYAAGYPLEGSLVNINMKLDRLLAGREDPNPKTDKRPKRRASSTRR